MPKFNMLDINETRPDGYLGIIGQILYEVVSWFFFFEFGRSFQNSKNEITNVHIRISKMCHQKGFKSIVPGIANVMLLK